MSALPEIHLDRLNLHEPDLPLASDGVLRYVWHSRFGDILIEVREGKSFVNGQMVVPSVTAAAPARKQ